MKDVRLFLDNIRSVENVGSIFRTAETLGVNKIYFLGTTPLPIDRFGRKRKDLAKVALGAEEMIPWEHVEDARKLFKDLKKEKFQIISLEQAENSIDYKEVEAVDKILIVLGNEVDGVGKEILEMSDVVAEIPMKGKKESLNVAVAAGVFLFRLLD